MNENVYSAPSSELVESNDVELATRGSRLGAAIIDTLTILPITLPVMYFTGGFDGISQGHQPSLLYTLSMSVLGTLIFLLIHGWRIKNYGQTWGKNIVNIKIVSDTNELPATMTLVKRYSVYWVLPMIPVVGQLLSTVNILFVFSKSRTCLHDRFAKTRVVKVDGTK